MVSFRNKKRTPVSSNLPVSYNIAIQKEMNSVATAVWTGSLTAFVWVFFVIGSDFSFQNIIYWLGVTVCARLLFVDLTRFIMLRR